MNREQLDEWCERGILGLVLAVLVFGPLATGAVRPQDFLVIQALTLGVVLLWLVRIWASREPRLLWPPICWAVVLFVGYAIVRYRQADIEYVAREELIKILIYAVLFFAVINNLNKSESAQVIAFTLIFLAMSISIYAVYQYLTHSDHVWHFIRPAQYARRGSGTYICPNHLAGFLEMILPLGLAYTLSGRLSVTSRVFLGYASLVILAGIGVTISRGGWIATGLSVLLFFALLIRKPGFRIPAFLFLAVLLASGVWFVGTAQFSKQRIEQSFVSGKVDDIRFQLWQPALQMWQDHFWVGVGPAHFDHRFPAYRPREVQARPNRVHNDYLNTLADWGTAGALLVAAVWLLLYFGVWHCWKYVQRTAHDRSSRKSNRAAFALGASIGLFALLLHGVVDFNFHIPANALVAITLMALLTAHWRFASERFWFNLGLAGKIAATTLGLVVVFYLGQQGTRRFDEYILLDRAAGPKLTLTDQIALLEQAQAVEPKNPETTHQLGESLRLLSFAGNPDYEKSAREAMGWFKRGMELNPHDAYNPLRYGMCLDWLDRPKEADPFFKRANELDPNGYYQVAVQGWHRAQAGDFAAAKPWFQRSMRLHPEDNTLAISYLKIIEERQKEAR